MSRSLLVALLVALGPAAASTEWQMQAALVYADNLFEYSPGDLQAFRQRSDPARFPIRTTDDLDATLGASFGWRTRLLERSSLLTLATRLHGYVSNPEKSYGVLTVRLSQGVTPTGRASLSYTCMPDYLIRHYRHPDKVAEYAACTFSEHLAAAGFIQRAGRATLAPRYRYEVDIYAPPFGFYDTRAHRLGAELGWDPLSSFRTWLDYEYKLASAQGPAPDISYRQHRAELRVLTRPRRLSRFSCEAGIWLARRAFTTSNSAAVDPGHAGRVDWLEGIAAEIRYQLSQVALVAGYESEWREVNSPCSERIEDVKNYRANRFRVGLTVTTRRRG